jgi:hypothetical protein
MKTIEVVSGHRSESDAFPGIGGGECAVRQFGPRALCFIGYQPHLMAAFSS